MKRIHNYFKDKKYQEIIDLGYEDYEEMFQEGFSDAEISREFGVNENYVRGLREEYESNY
jgi:hypothetical protein